MSRLTEQEQQEILRYIEADKPLPDKYRFLLFEDKREVELVWNGKSSEVISIVLPLLCHIWTKWRRLAENAPLISLISTEDADYSESGFEHHTDSSSSPLR